MGKDFAKELSYLRGNSNIEGKLMIISLYNECYQEILSTVDEVLIDDSKEFMETTFCVVASAANFPEEGFMNAERFMKIYFEILKKSKLFQIPQMRKVIQCYENNLENLMNASKDVEVIDRATTFSLDRKVEIIVEFREYVNNIFRRIIDFYKEEKSEKLRHEVLNALTERLESYITYNKENKIERKDCQSSITPIMMQLAKDYLIAKVNTGELLAMEDEGTKKTLAQFNPMQQKLILIDEIYDVAGYDRRQKEKQKEKIEDTCEQLGISRFRYKIILISILFRSLQVIDDDDIDRQEANEETYQKRK